MLWNREAGYKSEAFSVVVADQDISVVCMVECKSGELKPVVLIRDTNGTGVYEGELSVSHDIEAVRLAAEELAVDTLLEEIARASVKISCLRALVDKLLCGKYAEGSTCTLCSGHKALGIPCRTFTGP